MVNALLATYDENGVKQRQGLEECVLAFNTAIDGDFGTRLDAMAEVGAMAFRTAPALRTKCVCPRRVGGDTCL